MTSRGSTIRFAAAIAIVIAPAPAFAQRSAYQALITAHAKANNVPESLVHRVVMRESRYNPSLIGRGGVIGLMQIKLATAREVGYRGDATGLRDPETNLAYGVRYLAGAWRLANGSQDRAVSLYAHGYYYEAKRAHLPPMHFAALPLVATKPSDITVDSAPATPEVTPATLSADAGNQTVALNRPIPLPRPRPQLPGNPVATVDMPPTSPANSFAKFWQDRTWSLPGAY